MFGRGRRKSSGNIRTMQLFHELKQKFPTIPDHVVSACIASHANQINPPARQLSRTENNENHMGLSPQNTTEPALNSTSTPSSTSEESTSDDTRLDSPTSPGTPGENGSNSSEEQIGLPPRDPHRSRHKHIPKIGKILNHKKTRKEKEHSTETSSHRHSHKSKREHNLSKIGYVPEQKGNFYRVTRPSKSTDCEDIVERISDMSVGDASDINRNVLKPTATYSKKFDSVSVSVSDNESNIAESIAGNSSFFLKRPTYLDIKNAHSDFSEFSEAGQNSIPKSVRCSDVHKLLNSDNIANKPPRSPLREKRFTGSAKNSPTKPLASPETNRRFQQPKSNQTSPSTEENPLPGPSTSPQQTGAIKKTENPPKLVETPTQTTDTLLAGSPSNPVNLSLNVQCSVDVVQSPTHPKCKTSLEIVPQQPWCMDPVSPRSYTSVNLTLRPPSSEPQAPIDITSQNSSLTYSTSTFDRQNGLQSRLQITVGPGGSSSVSSMRARPRSSYIPEENNNTQPTMPIRAESLPDLAVKHASPVIIKQQARIERLKIELTTENTRLVSMAKEVSTLEDSKKKALTQDLEVIQQQLQKDIKQLQAQCEKLVFKIERYESRGAGRLNQQFYSNIYTGQVVPPSLGCPSDRRPDYAAQLLSNNQLLAPRSLPQLPRQSSQELEGPKWNCHLCTFLNHPCLDKCEECEMPRIVHVSAAPGDNIHIHVTPRLSRRMVHSWVL